MIRNFLKKHTKLNNFTNKIITERFPPQKKHYILFPSVPTTEWGAQKCTLW
nr:hypothetical protein [Marseillevirus cajuinensis]